MIQGLALLVLACGSDSSDRVASAPTDRADAASADVADPVEPPDRGGLSARDERGIVLFLGNSLTAGLGVDPDDAFPSRIQSRIDSAGLPFRVINGGLGGETSAGGLRRIDWLLEQGVDVLVLALGGNDALRGVPPDSMQRNLQAIVDRARARAPASRIVIAGIRAPPNLGETYTRAFLAVFPALARANDAALVPLLLDGVAAVPALNQADGIHPNADGHEIMAETVWRVLEGVLRAGQSPPTSVLPRGFSRPRQHVALDQPDFVRAQHIGE